MRANPHLILASLPDWLADMRTGLLGMIGDVADGRELVERIIVAEFNRHQASMLLLQCLETLVDPAWDTEYRDRDLIEKMRSLPELDRNPRLETRMERMLDDQDRRRLQQARRFMAYEKRFRGARDRGLRLLSKWANVKRGARQNTYVNAR